MARKTAIIVFLACLGVPLDAWPQAELVEIACPSCGYRQRFIQGSRPSDMGRNIEYLIVVCERSNTIRSVRVPLDPSAPVNSQTLVARQTGTGTSKMLGIELPKFIIPGNTCPLYPVTAYLDANICPVDGNPGVRYAIVGQF